MSAVDFVSIFQYLAGFPALDRGISLTAEDSIISGLPGRYAAALLDLAVKHGEVDSVMENLDKIALMIGTSPDFAQLTQSPLISRPDQAKGLSAVLELAGIKGLTANFAGVVAKNRRLYLLPKMIRQFRTLRSRHKGEVDAEVVSAIKLSEEQITALEEKLAKIMGSKIRLTANIDPQVLGGLVVRVGSRMVDSSLRTKLNNLQLKLKEVA